ncbi:MAG TPA: class I SAM-dependent methyltransferase [Acidimicrobiia bacterium]|nr:class I SAM-dependent methyltransferase [Acidimicrobiia bacterium]
MLQTIVTEDDREISAQARSMPELDGVLERLARHDTRQGGALLDLGCGMGGLANHIGGRLGVDDIIGVDLDAERLKAAGGRSLTFSVLNSRHSAGAS